LATSIGVEFGRSQTKKSVSKVAEQHERARSRVIEKFERASFDAKFDATEWQRAADKKG
jgi:predicted transcriptional regulator